MAFCIPVREDRIRGDTAVYLPKEKVFFSSDLLFTENNPAVRNGGSVNWQRMLEKFKSSEIEALVPDHGPIVKGGSERQAGHRCLR